MARMMAWLSAIAAAVAALVLGAEATGWTLWTFIPLVAPFAVRAKTRGSLRAPGLIGLAMGLAPVLLLCFMTASAIETD